MPARLPCPSLLPALVSLLLALLAKDEPRVFVVLPVDPSERGPSSCPPELQPLLADLDSSDAGTRLHARAALYHIDWRHLSWLRDEARRGSAERRLALRSIVEALRERRWSSAPSVPPGG